MTLDDIINMGRRFRKNVALAAPLALFPIFAAGCIQESKEVLSVIPDAGPTEQPTAEDDSVEEQEPTPSDPCSPGERLCYGNKLYRCTARNEYNIIQDCGESMKCFENPGVCASLGPDAYVCSEPIVLRFHEGTMERWKSDRSPWGEALCAGDEGLTRMPLFSYGSQSLSFTIPAPKAVPQQPMKIFMTGNWHDKDVVQHSVLDVKLDNLSLDPIEFTPDFDCKEYNLSTADLLDPATGRSILDDGAVTISVSLKENCESNRWGLSNCFGLSQMRVSYCNPEYKNLGEGPSRREPFCDVGSYRCFDNRYLLECTSLGWVERQDCGVGLCSEEGSCVPLCEEGKYRCEEINWRGELRKTLYQCQDSSWQQQEECRQCGDCNEETGGCDYPQERCYDRIDNNCDGITDEDMCEGKTGDSCSGACERGYECIDYAYPGGYCSQNIGAYRSLNDCVPNRECLPGTDFRKSVCVMDSQMGVNRIHFESIKYFCVVKCENDDQCRTEDGYVCKQINDSDYKACLPSAEEVTIGKTADGDLCSCGD